MIELMPVDGGDRSEVELGLPGSRGLKGPERNRIRPPVSRLQPVVPRGSCRRDFHFGHPVPKASPWPEDHLRFRSTRSEFQAKVQFDSASSSPITDLCRSGAKDSGHVATVPSCLGRNTHASGGGSRHRPT